MITISDALYALRIDGGWKIKEGQIVKWWADKPQPSDEEIQTKLAELNAAEPIRLLREERNQKLQETDWTQYRDVSLSNDSDWQTYRQSLRDLPQNFSPIIDIITEDGYPIVKEQMNWPDKPS
mgnify:CR=1 FL=1